MVIHEPHAQIIQHTHTYKAVTGLVEAKKLLSLVENNQTIVTNAVFLTHPVAPRIWKTLITSGTKPMYISVV